VTSASPATQAESQTPSLERRLGPFDAAAIILSNVIGGGIFFVPILVAGLVPSAVGMLSVWLLGGVLAFAGAMAYAELAALRPKAGGEYVYLREAFGPQAAFLTGWTSFVAGFSGAIAASAVLLADYIGRFLPGAADTTPLLVIPLPFLPLTISRQSIVALAAIVGLSFVHMRGLGPGRLVHNVLAGLKVSGIVVFIALGLSFGSGSWGNLASTHEVLTPATGWLLALIPVMFSYSGWNAAAYVAEEIRDPGRNVPIALGLGTAAVVAIYLALNVLYFYALPLADIAVVPGGRLTDTVAERLFGFAAGNLIAIFTIISVAASISAMVLAGPFTSRWRVTARFSRRWHGCIRSTARRRAPSGRRRSGAPCWCFRRRCPNWSTTRVLRLCCSPASRWPRCSCCGCVNPTPNGPSGRGAIPTRPACSWRHQPPCSYIGSGPNPGRPSTA
jgi:basic amino acid/polyamine antiporter, APA family